MLRQQLWQESGKRRDGEKRKQKGAKEKGRGDNQVGWDGADLEGRVKRSQRLRPDIEAYEHWGADDNTSIGEQEEMERDRQGRAD